MSSLKKKTDNLKDTYKDLDNIGRGPKAGKKGNKQDKSNNKYKFNPSSSSLNEL